MISSAYDSGSPSSAPDHAITYSMSLPSITSSYSTLSGFSSSSSYHRGGADASFSLSSSLTSIEDLEAVPACEDWNHRPLCPTAHESIPPSEWTKRRSLRERLVSIRNNIRRCASDLAQGASFYNTAVGLVFCYYAWTLLLALSGSGGQVTAGDAVDVAPCYALLVAQPPNNGSTGSGDYFIPTHP
ncbi:uncharacterized protein PHACADRAFT_265033 [Phanerochaete carnosa HHB-10118-sp]|uniref:Uncharacterized protein n=1 Tax=Phanerochaete carnosa (strain HHB-10118-sp) TaxID=650164 RepID=K5VRW7_PHACS|nr:uncharacterized protein PHACADRAFT_265033 [Phanerochaete carnosa HHB-10118-sp]EKM49515.1 hypothetical protein PHACADRAFT_265033 [Phanerochaete carnosa HHB-10118-sp]